ncbi:regulatory protein, tetR family [Parafrankia irregularis]|uniref:Regulatory protein, tetR family n=1 Tax=Parafrankia irregularis TaxID=795642 RepID=A0A0S4QXI6_9ACTN|nr:MULTISPECIES: TetR/AcrR family transcriptional regulator [Parafrankia]CUU59254.1 regulatory protein, tetR family [Parafrankia irregularis]
MDNAASSAARRRYESPVRRQRATETRERILAAGAVLAHRVETWDWHELTFRAVAAEAGVSESTVYRHFANERDLHDAVMQRLQEQAGVTYEGIGLHEVGDVAGRVFATLSSYAASGPAEADDPTFVNIEQTRRRALRAAVATEAGHLSPDRRDAVAGVLDVLWNPVSYRRLVTHWGLDHEQATEAIRRVIDLVVAAVADVGQVDGGQANQLVPPRDHPPG